MSTVFKQKTTQFISRTSSRATKTSAESVRRPSFLISDSHLGFPAHHFYIAELLSWLPKHIFQNWTWWIWVRFGCFFVHDWHFSKIFACSPRNSRSLDQRELVAASISPTLSKKAFGHQKMENVEFSNFRHPLKTSWTQQRRNASWNKQEKQWNC